MEENIKLNMIEKGFLIDCIYMAVNEGCYRRDCEEAAAQSTGYGELSDLDVDVLLLKLGASSEIIDEINNL